MTIEFNPKKAANLLKEIVNQSCEDGFLWYPNIGEMPNLYDINEAIKILEQSEIKTMEIIEE